MSRSDLGKKSSAALLLAGGKSQRAVAEEVGVNPATIRAWRRRPEFAAAVAELVALVREGGRSGAELLEAASEVLDRLDGGGRPAGTVVVTIPVDASPRRRRQLVARAVARVLEASEGDGRG